MRGVDGRVYKPLGRVECRRCLAAKVVQITKAKVKGRGQPA